MEIRWTTHTKERLGKDFCKVMDELYYSLSSIDEWRFSTSGSSIFIIRIGEEVFQACLENGFDAHSGKDSYVRVVTAHKLSNDYKMSLDRKGKIETIIETLKSRLGHSKMEHWESEINKIAKDAKYSYKIDSTLTINAAILDGQLFIRQGDWKRDPDGNVWTPIRKFNGEVKKMVSRYK